MEADGDRHLQSNRGSHLAAAETNPAIRDLVVTLGPECHGRKILGPHIEGGCHGRGYARQRVIRSAAFGRMGHHVLGVRHPDATRK